MTSAKLDDQTLRQALSDLDGWDLQDGKLHRTFVFRDFREAFGFMATVATIAEAMNHHPEWRNVWREVDVSLTTHDAGGITRKDVELASAMDERAARLA